MYHVPGTVFDSEDTMVYNPDKVSALKKFIFKPLGLDVTPTTPQTYNDDSFPSPGFHSQLPKKQVALKPQNLGTPGWLCWWSM